MRNFAEEFDSVMDDIYKLTAEMPSFQCLPPHDEDWRDPARETLVELAARLHEAEKILEQACAH